MLFVIMMPWQLRTIISNNVILPAGVNPSHQSFPEARILRLSTQGQRCCLGPERKTGSQSAGSGLEKLLTSTLNPLASGY